MKRKTLKILAGTFAVTACIALTGGLATEKTAAAVETEYSANTLQLSMVEGASVRISEAKEDAGIRFSMTLPKGEYEWLIKSTEGETAAFSEVTFGMFVAPNAYHTRYGLNDEANVLGEKRCYGWLKEGETDWATSEDGRSEQKLAQIINLEGDMFEDTKLGKMRFNGAVVNMREENFTKEYVGVGYIRYTTAGENAETHYVFAKQNDNVSSITYVAQLAVADTSSTKPTDEQKTFLNDAYINAASVQATASDYYIDYYLRGADGTYVKDDALTQTVSSTVNAKVNVTYDMLNPVNGYIFNENFNKQLEEVTVYANNRTPHVRVNLENGTIADFENTSDIWGVMNPNGAAYAVEMRTGLEEYGKMLKLSTGGDSHPISLTCWTKKQLSRAQAAGYTYLKLDVYYHNSGKNGFAFLTVCDKQQLPVATNTITTLSFDLSQIAAESDDKGTINFWIGGQAEYAIYVDNIRFGTDTSPTTDVTYLYDGFEKFTDSTSSALYSYNSSCTYSLTSKDGSQVVQVAANNGALVGLVNPVAGGWTWSALYEQYAGKTLKFKIYLEKDSWVSVGYLWTYAYSQQHTAGSWMEISVSIDVLNEKGGDSDWLNIVIGTEQTCYVDDFKIV